MVDWRPRPHQPSAINHQLFHRPHHYGALIQRWRAVARAAGVQLRRFSKAGDDPLFYLKTPALAATGGIYISAAIHGDEPASSEALITWAEAHIQHLAEWPLLLFPCLNPWGLRNNLRLDETGVDLNRAFQLDDHPVIAALKKVVAPFELELALMLHEDYDGQGFYLYEIKRDLPFWGEDLLAVAARQIAIDPRKKIDGRNARAGLIRRRFDRARFERLGFPEAIWLHEFHARRALTTETPSEFALEQRVRAHVAVLDECVRRVLSKSG
jgi:predicted deacylase